MNAISRLAVLCLSLLIICRVEAASKTKATLLLAESAARPGDVVTAAIQLQMQPGWHTYWRNPGGPGIATSIDWDLPQGFKVGQIQWPLPKKFKVARLTSYVFEKEVLLIVPITIAPDAPKGNLTLKGKVDWLECDDKTCVPAKGTVSASLVIGDQPAQSGSAALIQEWQRLVPRPNPKVSPHAYWENAGDDEERPLIIEWNPLEPPNDPDFYPYETNGYKVRVNSEIISATPQLVRLRKTVVKPDEGWPTNIVGVVISASSPAEGAPLGTEVSIKIDKDKTGASASAGKTAPAEGASAKKSIWLMIGLAFVGGLILNIMPCVLPVIALKILGFVRQSAHDPGRVRRLGLIYALGVWTSFLLLAALIIAVKRAGGSAAWGMQFQNPQFLVGITALVTLVALNLFGVFEVMLGGKALGAASDLASKEGATGAFFNGVLTTVLATPCTAPYLAGAIGYAVTQPASTIMLLFSVVAVGLATPYVLLSWNPALMKFLPKPGNWMVKFKIAMGFPMLATAIWLFSLSLGHFGRGGALWLGLFLVVLACAAWIWGEFVQRSMARPGLARIIALVAVVAAYFGILEKRLNWRSPVRAQASSTAVAEKKGGIEWQNWSRDAVLKAQTEGHPVLVDFTADWCFNCQLNKERAIEIDAVRKKIKDTGTVALIADFTMQNPEIAAELARHQRSAVPLVLVYPPIPNAPPEILPVWLNPSDMLGALDRAAAKKSGAMTQK